MLIVFAYICLFPLRFHRSVWLNLCTNYASVWQRSLTLITKILLVPFPFSHPLTAIAGPDEKVLLESLSRVLRDSEHDELMNPYI